MCQSSSGALGTARSISTRNQLMPVVTFGITDQMPPNNGSSTLCMVVFRASLSSVGSEILLSASGSELHGCHLPSTLLDHSSDSVNMITTLMTTSTSVTEHDSTLCIKFFADSI